MEQAAAEQMEGDYNRAYAEFSLAHAQSAPLVAALETAQAGKAALAGKLEALRGMVAQVGLRGGREERFFGGGGLWLEGG